MRCRASPPRNCTAPATPALGVALGKVHHAVGHITAKMGTGLSDCAVSFVFDSSPDVRLERQQLSNAKRRNMPAGMRQAICAASTTMVPLPQQGSYRAGVLAVRVPAAGSDHRGGQGFLSGGVALVPRQPRLNSGSPLVSMYSVASSVVRCM